MQDLLTHLICCPLLTYISISPPCLPGHTEYIHMSDLWTRLISNPYVLRSSPLVRSLFDILRLCYISEKPPLSLLGVANEPSFTQKASSRLIRKILNSCRDTSRQGVDQRGMQDLIPALVYPLLNLASPIPGQGQPGMQPVRTCISKKFKFVYIALVLHAWHLNSCTFGHIFKCPRD